MSEKRVHFITWVFLVTFFFGKRFFSFFRILSEDLGSGCLTKKTANNMRTRRRENREHEGKKIEEVLCSHSQFLMAKLI